MKAVGLYPCPVCHREVARTKKGIREHVLERHPDVGWSSQHRDAVDAYAALCALLDTMSELNEQHFTWLWAAVQIDNRRRDEASPSPFPPVPAGAGDGRKSAWQPPPDTLDGTLRIEVDQGAWPEPAREARVAVFDAGGIERHVETFELGCPALKAAAIVGDLARLYLQAPAEWWSMEP